VLASAAFFSLGSALLASDVDAAAVCAAPGRDTIPTSGIVNSYWGGASATNGGTNATITLGNQRTGTTNTPYGVSAVATTGISAGDLLIVMQMQGPTAGTYEYVTAVSPAGPTTSGAITVRGAGTNGGLLHSYTQSYSAGNTFQVIRVPQTLNATLGNYTAAAWDVDASGYGTGGVFALDIAQQATLSGTINVVGQGFRGGAAFNLTGNTAGLTSSTTAYPADDNTGGSKGEGTLGTPGYVFDGYAATIKQYGPAGLTNAAYSTAAGTKPAGGNDNGSYAAGGSFGFGAMGSAGGGGNDALPGAGGTNQYNSGGAGGGNAGRGGQGGWTWLGNAAYCSTVGYTPTQCPFVTNQGITDGGGRGGAAVGGLSAGLVTLGGGGGAASVNNNNTDANTISTYPPIDVAVDPTSLSGGSTTVSNGADGAISGSGARGGGIVLIRAGTFNAGAGQILADGVRAYNQFGAAASEAAGGGGAGGAIVVLAQAASGTLQTSATGGRGGDPDYYAHGPGGGGGGGYVLTNFSVSGSVSEGGGGYVPNINTGPNFPLPNHYGTDAVPGIVGYLSSAGGTTPGTLSGAACTPDVAATVTLPSAAAVGAAVNGSFNYVNNGPSDAIGAGYGATLPAGLGTVTFGTITLNGVAVAGASATYNNATGAITYTGLPGTLPNGQTLVVPIGFTMPANGTSVTGTDAVSEAANDPVPSNNNGSATVNGTPQADDAVTITGLPATASPSTAIFGVLNFVNNGPSVSNSVTYSAKLPVGAAVSSIKYNGTTLTGASATVGSDGTVTFTGLPTTLNVNDTVTVAFNASMPGNGASAAAMATIAAATTDPNTSNNTATAVVTGQGTADLATSITGVPTGAQAAGSTFTGSVNFQNNGSGTAVTPVYTVQVPPGSTISASQVLYNGAPINGLTVTIDQYGNVTFGGAGLPTSLANGDHLTIGFSSTMPADGSNANVVSSISSPTTDPNTGNNNASVTVTGIREADLQSTVTGFATFAQTAGTTESGMITFANNGPSGATGVTYTSTVSGSPTSVTLGTPMLNGVAIAGATATYNTGTGAITYTGLPTTLNSGDKITVPVSFPMPGNPVTVSSNISSNTTDPVPSNNAGSQTLNGGNDLAVTLTNWPTAAQTSGTAETSTATFSIVSGSAVAPANYTPALTLTPGLAGVTITATAGVTATYNAGTGVVTFSGLPTLSRTGTTNFVLTINYTMPTTNVVAQASISENPNIDTYSGNNTATATVPGGAAMTDIATTITGLGGVAAAGSTVSTGVINFTNAATNIATGTSFAAKLPLGATVTAITLNGTVIPGASAVVGSDGTVTFTGMPATMAKSAVIAVAFSFPMPADGSAATATATVTSTNDSNAANNTATATETGDAPTDLQTKVTQPASAAPNVTLNGTLDYLNNGPANAVNPTYQMTLPVAGGTPTITSVMLNGSLLPVTASIAANGVVTFTGMPTSLSSGDDLKVAYTYKTPASGSVSTTGSISYPGTDTVPGNNSATGTTTVTANAPTVMVTKTVDHTTHNAGDSVNWTLTVTNTGNSATTGVITLSDTLPAGITNVVITPSSGTTCLPANPSAGTTLTCSVPAGLAATTGTATVGISATLPSAGTYNNSVTPSGNASDNPTCAANACSTVTVVGSATMQVFKTSVHGVGNFGYQLTNMSATSDSITTTNQNTSTPGVINVVTSLSTPITINENTFPEGFTVTSASCVDTNSAVTGNTGSFGTLAGNTLTIATANIKQNSTLQCTFVNTVTEAISIAKTGPTAMTVGTAYNYTLTLTNTSATATVTTASVSDQLPAGFTFNSGSGNGWTCSAVAQLVSCNFLGTIAAKGTSIITINATPTATAAAAINYATVDPTGGTAPAAPSGCTASTTCALSPAAAVTATGLSISKSAPVPGLTPTGNSTYTLTVTNNGTTAIAAQHVRDQLPSQLTFVSATGTNWVCTENTSTLLITCTSATALAAGASSTIAVVVKPSSQAVVGTSVTNYASIDPTGNNAPPTPGPSCTPSTACAAQTSTVDGPNVMVTKTVDQATHAQGDTITWTIRAANTGAAATAAAITLTDSLPTGISNIVATPSSGTTCLPATPVAGGTLTCTVPAGLAANTGLATVTITATAATTGNITNSVVPSGTDNPTCASGACSASTMVGGQSLTLLKALTGPRVANTDQFTVQISNGATVVASATTTGSGNTVTNGSTGETAVNAATAYTLGEVAAGTTTLSSYTSTLACTNATTGSTTTLPTTVGGTVTPAAGDRITCTITNSALPLLTLTKALGTARVKDTDQFTIQILQGATTFASATTTGSGSTLGSNTTGAVQAAAGTTYTLNEIAAAGSGTNLSSYNSSLACVNSTAGSATVLPTTLGGALTPANGDNITCTLTNSAAPVLVTSITGLPASAEPGASINGVLNYSNSGGVSATGVVYSGTLPTGLTGVVLGTPAINGTPVTGATASYNAGTGAITFTGMPSTQAAGLAGAVTVALTFTMPAANATVTTRETSSNAATVNGTATVTEVPQTTLTTAPTGLPTIPTAPGSTVNGSLTFNNTGANPALNTGYSATLPTGLSGVVLGTPTVNGVAVTGATATYNSGTGAITITGLPATQPAGATGNVAVSLQFVMPAAGTSVTVTTQETADNAPTANGTATVPGETLTTLTTAPTGLPTAAQAPGTTVNGSLTFNNTGASIAYNPGYSATLPAGLTGVVLGTPTVNGVAVTGATATYNAGTGAITITGLPATQAAGATGSVAVPLQFVMPAAGTNVVVTTQETANNATTANGTATVTGETTTLAATPAGLPTTPQAPGATVNGSLTFDNTGTNVAANTTYSATLPTGLTGAVLGTPTVNGVAVTGATASYNSGTGAITIAGLPATQAAGATGNVAVPLQFAMPTNGANVLVTTTETASNATTATGQATVTGEALTTLATAPTGLPTAAQVPGATVNGSLTFNNTGTATAYNPAYSGTLATGLTGVVLGTPTVNGVAVTGATATYNAGTGAITIAGLPATQAAGATGNVAVSLQFVMPATGTNVVVTTQETASNAPTANGTATVTGETTTIATAPTGLPTTPQAAGTTVNGSLTFSNTGANVAANPTYAATLPTGLTGVVLGTPTVNGVAVTGATATYNSGTGAITIAGLPATQAAGAAGNVAVSLQFVMPASGANVVVNTTETASNATTANGQATVTGEAPTTLVTAPTGLPTAAQAPGTTVNGSLTFNNTGTAIAYNPVYSGTLPAGLTGVVLGTPTVNGVAVTGATATYNTGTGAITLTGMPVTQAAGAAGNVAVSLQFVMPAAGGNVVVTTTESASNATTANGTATVTGETTTLTATPTGLPTTMQAPGATVNGSLTFDNTGANVAANPVYSGTLPTGLTGVVLGTPTVNGTPVTGATATYNSGTGAITITGLPATQAAGAAGNVAVPLTFTMPASGANVLVTTTETASNAPTATGQATVTGETLTTLTTTPAGLPTAAQTPGATVNGSLTYNNTGAATAFNPVYTGTLPAGLTGVVLGTPTVNGTAVTGAVASYNSATGAITVTGMPTSQASGATGNVAIPLQFVMPAVGTNVLVTTTESASNATTANGQVTVTGETTTLAATPAGLPTAVQAPGATVNGSLTFDNTGANVAANPGYAATLPTGLTGVVLGTPTVNGVAVTGATATYNSGTGAITITGLPATQAAGAAGNVAVPLQFVMPASGANVLVTTTETASNAPTATGQTTVNGEAPTTLTTAPTGLPSAAQAPGATVNGSLTFNNTGTATAYSPVYSATLPTGLTGVVLGQPTVNGVAVTGATATYNAGTGAITIAGLPATQAAGATGNVAVSLQFVMPAAGGNVVVTTQESASNATTANGTATVTGETTTLTTVPTGLPTAAQAPGATVNGSLTYDNTGANAAANPVYSGSLPTGLTGVVLGQPAINGTPVTGATATYNSGTGAITLTGMPATQAAGAAGNVTVSLQFVMPAAGTSVVVNTSESASNAPTATGQATVPGQSLATVATAPTGLPTAAQAPGATVNGSLTYSNTGATLAYNPVYGGTLPAGLSGVVLGQPAINGTPVTGATASYNVGTGAITLAGMPTTQAAGAAGNVTVALQFVMPASGANVIVNTSESASNATTATGTATVTGETTTLTAAPAGLPTTPQAPGASVSGSLTFNNTGAVVATNPVYSGTLPTGLTGVVLGTPTVNGVAVTGATASYNSGTGAITVTGMPTTQAAGAAGNVAIALTFTMPASGANVLVTATEAASDATTATGNATVTGEALTTLAAAPTGLPTAAQAPGSTVNGSLTFDNTGTATAYNPVYTATLPTGLTGVVLGTPTVNGVAVTGATATYNSATGAITLAGMPTTQAAGATGNVAVALQFVMPAAGTNVLVTTTESASNATTATGQATVTGETTTLASAPSGLPTTPQAPGSTVNGSLTFGNTGANVAANPVYSATLPAGLTGVVLGTPTVNGVAVTGAAASYNAGSGAITVTGMPSSQAAGAAGNVAIALQFVMPTGGTNVVVNTSESASNAPTATGTATVLGEALTTIATAPTGLPPTPQAPGATVTGSLTYSNTGASTAYSPVYGGSLPAGLSGVVLGTPTLNGVAVTGATATYNTGTGAITLAGMPSTQATGAAGNVAVSLQFVMPAAGGNVVVNTSESASNAPTATGTATVIGEALTSLSAAPAGLPTAQQAPGATVNGSLTFNNTGANTAFSPVYSGTLPAGLTGVVLGTPTLNGVAVTGATASYNAGTGAITITGMPTTQASGAAGNVAVPLQFVMPASGANVLVTASESASNAPTATGNATVNGETLTTLTTAPTGLPGATQAPGATVNGSLTFNNSGAATAFNPVYSATLPTGLTGVVLGTPTVNGVAVTGATATYTSGSGAITIAGLPATQAAGATGNVAVPLQFVMPASGANVLVTTTESASNASTANGSATVTGEPVTTIVAAPAGLPTVAQAPGATVNGSLTFDNTGANTAFNPVYSATLPTGLSGVVLGQPTVNGVAVTGATASYNAGTGAITVTGLPATQAAGAAGNVAVPLQFVMPSSGSNVLVTAQETSSNAPTSNGQTTVSGEALTTLSTTPSGLPTTQQGPGATVNGSLTFNNTGANTAFNPVYSGTLPTGLTGVVLGTPTVNGVAVTGATATYTTGTGAITITGLPATQAAGATGNVAVPLQFVMPASGANVLVTTTETASNATTANGNATVNGETPTALTVTPTGLPTTPQAPGATVTGSLTYDNTGTATAFAPVYSGALPAGLTGVVLGTPTVNGVAVTGAVASYNSGTGAISVTGMPATQPAGATGNVAIPLQFAMPATGASVVVHATESASNATTATGQSTVTGETLTTLAAAPSGLPTTPQSPGATVTGSLTFDNTGASTAYNPVYSGTLPTGLTGVVLGTPTVNGVAVTGATATYTPATGAITIAGLPATQAAGATGNVAVPLQFVMPVNGSNVVVTTTESASNATTATGQATVNGEALTTLATSTTGLPTTQQAPGATVTGSLTFSNTGTSTAFNPVYGGTLPTGLTGVVLGQPTINGVPVTGATATYNPATGVITLGGMPATQAAGAAGNVAVPLSFTMPANGANVVINTSESASNAPTATGQSTVNGEALTTLTTAPTGLPTTQQAPGATVNGSLTFANSGTSVAFNPVYGGTLPANLTGVVLGTPTVNGVAVTGATATYTPASGAITITGLPATQAAGAAGNVAVPLQFAMPATGNNVVVNTTESASNATTATGTATVNGEALTTLTTTTTGLPTVAQSPGSTVTGSLTFSNSGASTAFNPVYSATLPTGLSGVVLGTPTVNGVAVTGATANYNPATGAITITGMPATQASGGAGNVAVPLSFTMPNGGASVTVATQESASNAPTANGSVVVAGVPQTTLTATVTGFPTTVQQPGVAVSGFINFTNTGSNPATNPVFSGTLPPGLTGVVFGTPTLNGVPIAGATANYNPATGVITLTGTPTSLAPGAVLSAPLNFNMPASGTNVPITAQVTASNAPTANGSGTVLGNASADLAIQTSAPATVAPDGSLIYTLTITNNGPSSANNATFSDPLPASLGVPTASCAPNSAGVTCGATLVNGKTVSGTISSLPAGGSAIITITTTAPASGSVTNTATVAPPAGITDPVPANNTSSALTTVGAVGNNVDLSVTTSGTSTVQVNGAVSYVVDVVNGGPAAANNAVFNYSTAAVVTGVTWTCQAVGGGAVCPAASGTGNIINQTIATFPDGGHLVYTVHGTAPANAQQYVDTATITAPAGTVETNAANNTANTTTNVTNAAASSADVAVTLNGPTTVQPSAPVVYTVVVSNYGPANGNGTTLSAPVPGVVTNVTTTCTATGGAVCPTVGAGNNINTVIPTLPVGGELTFTITGTAPTSGTFSESATVTPATGTNDPVPSNNTAGPVVTTVPVLSADLSIQKNGPAQVLAGGVINYTIIVSNAGPNAGDGATVTDVLPAGLSNASVVCSAATGGAACGTAAITGGTLHAVAGALPAAGSITLTVSATAPASGTLSNSASVAAPAGVNDPNMGNNTAGPVSTTIVAALPTQADLSASITGPSIVAPNGTVTYVVTITNAGPAAGNNAPISDVLPSVLTNISAVCGNTVGGATCGAVVVNGKTVSSTIGALPVGASLTLTITATAPASGTFSNSASVGAAPGETDPNTANNVAGPVVTTIGVATGIANLGISKTGPDMVGAGSSFSYTLLVSNAGPAAANGALVSDAVPAGLTNIHATCSAPTNGAVCGPVQVAGQNVTSAVQALPALGTVTITVTVTAPIPSGLQPTTVVNRATITPPPGINDPDTSDNVSNAVETAIVSAGVSGTVWLDINHDKKLDAGDPLLPNWMVELFHNGVLVATTTTNAQGQYSFSGVPPGPGYSIDFRDPGSKAIYGTPTNGNEGVPNPDSNAVIGNGIIESLTLKPGINIVQQSLPVDPSGVVYDATVRTPVGGATVTLVGPAGFNPATELVGGTGNATQITESSGPTAGAYQFLLINPGQPGGAPVGTYTIMVTPPAGYLPTPAKTGGVSQPGLSFTVPGPVSATTAIQPQEGPPKVGDNGPGTIYYFNLVFNNGSGAVINNNVPLDRISGGALTVQKTGSTATADIGETVLYTVDVTSSVGVLPNVALTDRLPRGFTLIPGTTTINGVKAPDPKGNNQGVLTFELGSIPASVTVEIKYRVRVGVGAQQGDGINRAQASNPLGATSNVATFKVDVNGGVFTTNACVVGKVFIDCNGNQIQDENEIGIPGVRLYFSDGTFVVTDSEGKYSYCGLRPTTHTLKVDKTTLPPGSHLVESSNRNALDPNSLFIDLKNGELHQADFIEGSCSPQVMEETKARRGQGEVNAAQPNQKAAPALIFDSKPLNMSTPAAKPAPGAAQ
jgi:uncharacterized repeat protein (TIGR01451 family)